jgi:transposase
MQRKHDALEAALAGRMGGHQRFVLDVQLRHIDELDAAVKRLSDEIEDRLRPFAEAQRRLQTIPGSVAARRRRSSVRWAPT